MSIAKRFKTDAEAARSGVWLGFPDDPNSDGTVPAFKIARSHKQNKRYQKELRNVFKNLKFNDDGSIDTASLADEEAEDMLFEVFVKAILIDWRHFQPEDDGNELEYSEEAARQIFGTDDWVDLYDYLNEKSKESVNYNQKRVEAEAKNS